MIENWILVVSYDRSHFEAARNDWLKYNVYLHPVGTAAEALITRPRRCGKLINRLINRSIEKLKSN